MPSLKLGTRGSQLALFQANLVGTLLQKHASVSCEIVVIKTSSDRFAEAPLAQIGGKRLFVKEIEDALLGGAIDLAVHSSKDMPAVLPPGLAIGAVLPREDARDALVMPRTHTSKLSLEQLAKALGHGPHIGTSSVRRMAQLRHVFSGARFAPVRGNLDTRLAKLDTGQFDALILAAAGLKRLGHENRISIALPADTCIPAPGQGIIAVEIRSHDDTVRGVVAQIDDPRSGAMLAAERAVVARLGGGCQMPIGAHASVVDGMLSVASVVVSLDGERAVRASGSGSPADAELIGTSVAEQLLANGAARILAEVEHARASVNNLQP